VALAAMVAFACGSTSVTQLAGPDDVRCQATVAANTQSVAATGGAVTIAVTTTRDCAWTASSDASWIRLSPASGQGEASVTANVDANPQIVSRSGTVSVNGQRISIAEAARQCTFDLGSSSAQFGSSGGSGRIDVTTISGCTWQASTSATWITVATATHTSTGAVDFQVSANDGAARNGAIAIGGRTFVISQAAAPDPPPAGPAPGPAPAPAPNCTPTLTPSTVDAAAAPSTQVIQLTIGVTCVWSSSSNAPWVTVASGVSGTGPTNIGLSIAQNTGGARTGTVTIAGATVTIRQTALSCTFSIDPSTQSLPAGGGSGEFAVSTQNACAWTASKNASWITLTKASGTGPGTVTFSAPAQTSTTARSGTISVGGRTFIVTEAAAPCSYSLAPPSMSATADGGQGRVTVTTSSNCAWTAAAGAAWVELANTSGTGSGDVNFNVLANSATAPRSTTITVGGQAFTIDQAAAACTYAAAPASLSIAAGGGEGRFTLTTQAGCAWSASASATWVTMTTSSGTGSGDVVYTVQANSDPSARSATVTAGGQVHTINQAAAPAPCTYSIDPSSEAFATGGGSSTFKVTTQSGCAWTASTPAPWITLTTASGSGTGDVAYSVQANDTAAARSSTITVGGQTYGVSQAP
jgi:hypothetical protein